jgi:hypothetical protein
MLQLGRAREYLTDGEIARLITAAGRNRHGHRDATMVLVAYRLDIDQIFRPQMYSNTLLN